MTPLDIQWREPERFTAGDTLAYNRNLPAYLPSAGWAIQLTVSKALPQGGAQKIAQVVSVPDATNSFHTFAVLNFLGGVPTDQYILSEEVINAGNGGEQHQIYYRDDFMVGPSLATGAAGQIKSVYERLLEAAQNKLLDLEEQPFSETDQQRNRFVIEQRNALLDRIKWYEAKVKNDKQLEAVRNGQPAGNVQAAVFNIR